MRYFLSRQIRRKFPTLARLNGKDLPPAMGFDVEESVHDLPVRQPLASVDQSAGSIIIKFLEAYYAFFDCPAERQNLLDAYHDKAVFSLVASYNNKYYGFGDPLNNWLNSSRNLERREPTKAKQLLRRGRLACVASLADFPATAHDLSSFTLDVTLVSPRLMLFVMTGLFREVSGSDKSNGPVRYVTRTTALVPLNQGFVIVNDMWTVAPASKEQHAKFVQPAGKAVPAGQVVVASSGGVGNGSHQQLNDSLKQQMVEQFSIQSGMNLVFSKKCLEEHDWDYPRAGGVFLDLKARGVIPPEAFLK